MDIPESVRVGYRTYRIEAWSPMAASANDRFGECDNCQALIRVRGDLDPVKMANTLLHELLHACWYIAQIDDEDKQERTVSTIANQLCQVWRDNPPLVAWLNDRLADQIAA